VKISLHSSCIRIVVIALFLCRAQFSCACKYNVRDVGFSELGFQTYLLLVFVDSQTSTSLLQKIESAAFATLLHTNIKQETVDIHSAYSARYLKFLPEHLIDSLPVMVILDCQEKAAYHIHTSGAWQDEIWNLMDRIRSTPRREELLNALVQSYCVLLFLEGEDPQENKDIHSILDETMEAVGGHMIHLPKKVADPPRKISVPRDEREQEEILFWSIGLSDPSQTSNQGAAVCVLYGRGRVLEPVLMGNKITRDRLIRLISFVGQDCECSLDRDWILGRSLLMEWTPEHGARITQRLGFDPDHPMVRAEMRRILSFGTSSSWHLDDSTGVAGGYTEIMIDFDEEDGIPFPIEYPKALSGFGSSSMDDAMGPDPFRWLWVLSLCIAAVALFGGTLILWFSHRRDI